MLTVDQIRQKNFEKSMRGYRPDAVDDFLAEVAATVEQLGAEKKDCEQKMQLLAGKIEQYRQEEESLKSALLNAQRLGDNLLHEAKQKADRILREATSKAQLILSAAEDRKREEKENLRQLEEEVAGFKANLLGLYQQHIESLSELDRQVAQVHEAVFGPEDPVPGAEEPTLSQEEDQPAQEPLENAGAVVDSFRPADTEEPQQ